MQPSFAPDHLFLAQLAFRDNDIDAARKLLQAGIAASPSDASLHDYLVDIELLSDNPQQAAEAALAGLQKCPSGEKGDKWAGIVALYYRQVAQFELQKNNPVAAKQIALDVLVVVPKEPVFYDLLLQAEMAMGNHKQAVQYALQGIQNCPNGGNGLWHRLAAAHLLQAGQREVARSILELGLKSFPDDPDMARLASMI